MFALGVIFCLVGIVCILLSSRDNRKPAGDSSSSLDSTIDDDS